MRRGSQTPLLGGDLDGRRRHIIPPGSLPDASSKSADRRRRMR
jgi:hypothetical protein